MATINAMDFSFLNGASFNNSKGKRKRVADVEEGVEAEAMETFRPRKKAALVGEGDRPVAGKATFFPTYDGVIARKISGRKLKKRKASRAATLKQVGRTSTVEDKTRSRQVKKASKVRLGELREQIRLNKRARREQIEIRKRIKKENDSKKAVQKIANP